MFKLPSISTAREAIDHIINHLPSKIVPGKTGIFILDKTIHYNGLLYKVEHKLCCFIDKKDFSSIQGAKKAGSTVLIETKVTKTWLGRHLIKQEDYTKRNKMTMSLLLTLTKHSAYFKELRKRV